MQTDPRQVFVEFSPKLGAPDTEEIVNLSRRIVHAQSVAARVRLVEDVIAGLPPTSLRKRAALLVLRDLLRHDYAIRVREGTVELAARTLESWPGTPQEFKELQRKHLEQERAEQLAEEGVRSFIAKMETRRDWEGQRRCVHDLVADGAELAARVKAHLAGERLSDPIAPYLELVREDSCDSSTGLRTQDIWRYFRHTWALPYNWTPGRTMQFLVRDAAGPNHPVIGILGLGSSVIQITCRDDRIGWTLTEIERLVKHSVELPAIHPWLPDKALVIERLEAALVEARQDINPKGLIPPRITSLDRQILHVERVVERLEKVPRSESSRVRRSSWLAESNTDLFRRKRARSLLKILEAQREFKSVKRIEAVDRLEALLSESDGRAAVSVALQELKKRHVGSSLMDITVCGAIPPYNQLLGGKLVAMLACTPTVVRAYESKYSDAVSEIASSMKGEPVVRKPSLVFLGTTSLYESHSAQYERISIPVTKTASIRFECLGKTSGFTTIHFSAATQAALVRVTQQRHEGTKLITHKFGEGVNPKMRQIAHGLATLGLDGRFLKASSRRIVYGVRLARNTERFLWGCDPAPDYYLADDSPKIEGEVARHWLSRWALKRAAAPDVLNRLRSWDKSELQRRLTPFQSGLQLESTDENRA